MRFCSRCGDFSADPLLAFCPADGTPLAEVDSQGDSWDRATRVIEQKQNALKTQQKKLKWRRVILRAMLMTTLIVTVAVFNRSISVTVDQARGKLCIETFNDLNSDGLHDASEPPLPGLVFEVSGTGPATTLTSNSDDVSCAALLVGAYVVVQQPRSGWTVTTATSQTVSVTAGQAANVSFGSKQELGKLCIRKFDDRNGNGLQDGGEPGLSGSVFKVSGTGNETTLTTEVEGDVCSLFPVGKYTVAETARAGWTATTKTTQTVTLTTKQDAKLFFGSTRAKPDTACSEPEQSRERHIIIKQYANDWTQSIRGNRARIFIRNAPADVKNAEVNPDFSFTFSGDCATALVTVTYVSQVPGAAPVPKKRHYECAKTAAEWKCRLSVPGRDRYVLRPKGTPN